MAAEGYNTPTGPLQRSSQSEGACTHSKVAANTLLFRSSDQSTRRNEMSGYHVRGLMKIFDGDKVVGNSFNLERGLSLL